MQQYNIHTAKTQLSTLVEKAAVGEAFIIAKAGKPMVKVIPFVSPSTAKKRIGFLKGQIKVPADFNQMGQNEIIELFEAQNETAGRYSPSSVGGCGFAAKEGYPILIYDLYYCLINMI